MGGSFGKKKSKIIIVGLDNSGKSTMINMLKPKKVPFHSHLPIVRRGGDRGNRGLQGGNVQQAQNKLHCVRHVGSEQIPQSLGVILR